MDEKRSGGFYLTQLWTLRWLGVRAEESEGEKPKKINKIMEGDATSVGSLSRSRWRLLGEADRAVQFSELRREFTQTQLSSQPALR